MGYPHYIKISFRNLKKLKSYNIQKVFSLTVSLAVCIISWLYIQDELSYDNFYSNKSRIYRVNTELKASDLEKNTAKTSDVIGPLLARSLPEVKVFTRLFVPQTNFLVKKGDIYLKETSSAYVDSAFFNLFEVKVLDAASDDFFQLSNAIVITESTARNYFGNSRAIGRTLDFDKCNYEELDKNTYTVTAVVEDFPDNSHIDFDFLLPIQRLAYGWDNFVGTNFYTYIMLKQNAGLDPVLKKLDHLVKENVYPGFSQQLGVNYNSWEDFQSSGHKLEYKLMPINRIHLDSNLSDELDPTGNREIIYIIALLVILVWFISCINFSNVSLVQLSSETKRIGVQKILGATKKSIVLQCLFDGFFLIVSCFILSALIIALCLPFLNDVLQKSFSLDTIISSGTAAAVSLLFVITCTASLGYSALYLINLNPVASVKDKKDVSGRTNTFTRVLIVFQFSVSIIFIGASLIIYQQLKYINTRDLGYSKEQVLVVDNLNYLGESAGLFKENVLKIGGVKSGTVASTLPMEQKMLTGGFTTDPGKHTENFLEGLNWFVDESFLSTLDIKIIKGRDFSASSSGNYQSVLINERMEKLIGSEAVGKVLYTEVASFEIIGVVKDFNYSSFREQIKPMVLNYSNLNGNFAAFKIETANLQYVSKEIQELWNNIIPGNPISFYFMDDAYEASYKKEQLLSNLTLLASFLSISIAIMGLFGLISFTTNQRSKEISIRKVLGASNFKIIQLISTDFMKLIVVAIFLSIPISWWIMKVWLDEFVYRVSLETWMFIVPAFSAFIITFLTSMLGTIKRIHENPVHNLKEK